MRSATQLLCDEEAGDLGGRKHAEANDSSDLLLWEVSGHA